LMSVTSFSILVVVTFVAFLCAAAVIYFLTRDKNGGPGLAGGKPKRKGKL
jgi:hypothetical protein